jgi:hypothetical protein
MAILKFPGFMLSKNGGYYTTKDSCSVDICIVDEIKYLWENEIHTMNCCCGHGRIPASVIVRTDNDAKKIMALGYKKHPYERIENCFLLKSKHKSR